MARIRSIKPELFMSPQVMNVGPLARLLFIGLISQADDEGRGSADPRKLKGLIFSGDDAISATDIGEMLDELALQDLCVLYDGIKHGRLYALPSWGSHQYVERPRASAYPAPPKGTIREGSVSKRGIVGEPAGKPHGGSDLKDLKDLKDLSPARARARGSGAPARDAGKRSEAAGPPIARPANLTDNSPRFPMLPAKPKAANGSLPASRDLPAEVRILAAAGNSAGDIVKLLHQTVTVEQVEGWLA